MKRLRGPRRDDAVSACSRNDTAMTAESVPDYGLAAGGQRQSGRSSNASDSGIRALGANVRSPFRFGSVTAAAKALSASRFGVGKICRSGAAISHVEVEPCARAFSAGRANVHSAARIEFS
jgi:hypothetical protein